MIDSIHMWAVYLAEKYSLVIFFLSLILFMIGTAKPTIKFQFPDRRVDLPYEIMKLCITIYWRCIPSGILFGMIFLDSSNSTSDLLMLPIVGLGFPVGAVIIVIIKYVKMGQRHYKY